MLQVEIGTNVISRVAETTWRRECDEFEFQRRFALEPLRNAGRRHSRATTSAPVRGLPSCGSPQGERFPLVTKSSLEKGACDSSGGAAATSAGRRARILQQVESEERSWNTLKPEKP